MLSWISLFYLLTNSFYLFLDQYQVTINDEMVEQLTPPETVDATERKEILKDLARALKKQGSFILASKKYTQAGDRIRAMKCLVRGGDTKAVIQFASISRNGEIYKLAANYLQQMNWRESADIMRAIIAFYTKAKSFEQLAGFYDSCAQVEIDDYRDYDKAIGALREALKYLGKAETRQAKDMAEMTERRVSLMTQFVEARKALQASNSPCHPIAHFPIQHSVIVIANHNQSQNRFRYLYSYRYSPSFLESYKTFYYLSCLL